MEFSVSSVNLVKDVEIKMNETVDRIQSRQINVDHVAQIWM